MHITRGAVPARRLADNALMVYALDSIPYRLPIAAVIPDVLFARRQQRHKVRQLNRR